MKGRRKEGREKKRDKRKLKGEKKGEKKKKKKKKKFSTNRETLKFKKEKSQIRIFLSHFISAP